LYSSDVVAFALGRPLNNGLEDTTLFKDLLLKAPETLKRGVRYSQIFLQSDSPLWKQILSLLNNRNKDFLDFFLYVCQRLHPNRVDYITIGLVFEDLIRRFNEAANETADDHFTPREVLHLMVNLLLAPGTGNCANISGGGFEVQAI
jgi:hypothetical protein